MNSNDDDDDDDATAAADMMHAFQWAMGGEWGDEDESGWIRDGVGKIGTTKDDRKGVHILSSSSSSSSYGVCVGRVGDPGGKKKKRYSSVVVLYRFEITD